MLYNLVRKAGNGFAVVLCDSTSYLESPVRVEDTIFKTLDEVLINLDATQRTRELRVHRECYEDAPIFGDLRDRVNVFLGIAFAEAETLWSEEMCPDAHADRVHRLSGKVSLDPTRQGASVFFRIDGEHFDREVSRHDLDNLNVSTFVANATGL